MSIEATLKKEYKKLCEEKIKIDRLLEAIQHTMREYNIWYYPSPKSLCELIICFLQSQGGHAKFESILAYLQLQNIDIPNIKLSQILTNDDGLHYNKTKSEWEIIRPLANDNPDIKTSSHPVHRSGTKLAP